MAKWERIRKVRDDVNKALKMQETRRPSENLEAMVQLTADGELYDFLKENEEMLAQVFIVSQVQLHQQAVAQPTGEMEGLAVAIEKAQGEKMNAAGHTAIQSDKMQNIRPSAHAVQQLSAKISVHCGAGTDLPAPLFVLYTRTAGKDKEENYVKLHLVRG